jgi:CheY-like chemotaxis protein
MPMTDRNWPWSSTTSPTNRLLAGTLLKRWGWTVREAESGEAALTLSGEHSLPAGPARHQHARPVRRRNLRSAAGQGQAAPNAHHLPTRHTPSRKIARLLAVGFDDVLVKPINRQRLEELVGRTGLGAAAGTSRIQ